MYIAGILYILYGVYCRHTVFIAVQLYIYCRHTVMLRKQIVNEVKNGRIPEYDLIMYLLHGRLEALDLVDSIGQTHMVVTEADILDDVSMSISSAHEVTTV